jgi:folate-binding protein YgfZ
MASIQEQCAWLADTVGVFVTDDRVLRVGGEDAESWLSGQVTADLRNLKVGEAVYALSVSLKGRIVTDLWVVRDPDGLLLSLPAHGYDAAVAAYDKHIIMEDVELTPSEALCVVAVQGPKARQLFEMLQVPEAGPPAESPGPLDAPDTLRHFPCARLFPRPGLDVWVAREQLDALLARLSRAAGALGGGRVEAAAVAQAHVVLAVPRLGIDFGAENYPQEAGLKARAVSFNKGCYVGQEVVYMLENRGQLARRLVQLECPASSFAAGDQVLDATGKRVGELTSVAEPQPASAAGRLALAYVKRASAEAGARVLVREQECHVRCVVGLTDGSCPIVASE